MASPSSDTAYPVGGNSKRDGGQGIFYDHEADESLQVWVDLDLRGRSQMLRGLQDEGAVIAIDHWSETTHILILSAKSVHIFNMYCHPEWLRPNAKHMYYRAREKAAMRGDTVDDPWKKKVLLKEWWVQHCLDAGEFLGEQQGWSGCRAGGQLSISADSSPPTSTPRFVPPLPKPDPLLLTPDSFKSLSPAMSLSPPGSPPRPESLLLQDTPVAPTSMPDSTEIAMDVEDEDESSHHAADARDVGNLLQVDPLIAEREGEAASPPRPKPHDGATVDVPAPDDDNEVGGQSFQTEMDEVDQAVGLGADTEQDIAYASITQGEGRDQREEGSMDVETPSSPPHSVLAPEHDTFSASLPAPPTTSRPENATHNASADQLPSDTHDSVISQRGSTGDEAVEMVEDKEPERGLNFVRPPTTPQVISPQITPTTSTGSFAEERDGRSIVVATTEALPGPRNEGDQNKNPALDPSLLFAGLRFWVDPKRPNRTQLLRSIQKAGGKIVADYSDSTHVLVHAFATSTPVDRDHWQQIMREVVPQGVWFLNAQWALKSLDSNRRLSELDFHLPGGAPDTAAPEIKPEIATTQQESQAEGSQTAAKKRARLPLGQILQTFSDNKALLESMTDYDAGVSLARNRGVYSSKKWAKLVRQFRIKEGRFAKPTEEENEEQIMSTASSTTRSQVRNEAGPCSSELQPVIKSHSSSSKNSRKPPIILENLDARTLQVLRIAYDFAIKSRRKRKGFLRSYLLQTSIKDLSTWVHLFDEYQRKEGFSKHTDAELIERFKACPPLKGDMNKGYIELLESDIGFDRDGVKALYKEWASGIWPAKGHNQTPVSTQLIDQSIATVPSPTTGTSSPVIKPEYTDSGLINDRLVRQSNEEVARILLPVADDIDALTPSRVASTLLAELGIYSHRYWVKLISAWRHGKGRFEGHGPKWDPSKPLAPIKSSSSLPKRNPARSPNNSATDVPVSAASPKSATLRISPVKVSPFASQPNASTVNPPAAHLSNDELDFIFKRYSPLVNNGMAISDMCNLLVDAHGSYTARIWSLYFSDWKRKSGRFEDFVPDPDYKPRATKRRRSVDSASNASAAGAASTSRKRPRRGYSDEEEKNMAKYIVSRQPEDTRPNVKDWEDFAKRYPTRSAAGYAEHYRGYSSRIDRLVHEVSSLGTGERELSVETQDSDDDSVIEVAPPSAEKPKQFVDMTGFDSD